MKRMETENMSPTKNELAQPLAIALNTENGLDQEGELMTDKKEIDTSSTSSRGDSTLSSIADKLMSKRTVRATLTTDGNSYPVKLRKWTRGTITVKPDLSQLFGREADVVARSTSEASDTSPPEDAEDESPVAIAEAEIETGVAEAEVETGAVEVQTESEAV